MTMDNYGGVKLKAFHSNLSSVDIYTVWFEVHNRKGIKG